LFPVARELVEIDDQVYGYPVALTNLRHIVYDGAVITETVSTNWNTLVADSPGTFIFPAAGADGARLTAQFYQDFGGTYVDENGSPALQTEPLVQTLTLMQQGIATGFIDSQSGNISSLDEAWQLFQAEPRHILQTTAKFYMERVENEGAADLRTAAVPGPNGALAPAVGAWLWAISTPDAARQATAGELIRWLSEASYAGEWCLQSNAVPARRTAFEVWPANAYVSFLEQQVAQARPAPAGLNNSVLTVLGDATTAVLLGLSTPTESAEQAVTALAP
jgi:ABC-type glycerol-3-phosphate transport system substrate-binding protein